MSCSAGAKENNASAHRAVRRASRRGVDLCILPELFTNVYPGQFNDPRDWFDQVPDHRAVLADFQRLAREASVAMVVPFAERLGPYQAYNSLVVIDRHGTAQGHYRKIHIPDAEGYREDLYFRPGDLGYVVAPLGGLRLGVAVCWDQWFPEVSRTLALLGAQLVVYPSAIGSEVVVPDYDSRPEWELVMRAQAVMNRVFVAAVNRVGQEDRIRFYGGSFVADPWGRVMGRASRTRPETLYVTLNLSEIPRANSFFGFFTTRRPETYDVLTKAAPRGIPGGH